MLQIEKVYHNNIGRTDSKRYIATLSPDTKGTIHGRKMNDLKGAQKSKLIAMEDSAMFLLYLRVRETQIKFGTQHTMHHRSS